jgi:predicted DNA-binding WGR domain protein
MVRRATSHHRAKPPTYEAVRRLEKLEGGSTFFYEVSRQDKWVVVKSGRVNLPSQTRMREYPTPPAASVAMERLVEDRLKEGWMDPEALVEHKRKLEEQARAREAAKVDEGATRPRRAQKGTRVKRPRTKR